MKSRLATACAVLLLAACAATGQPYHKEAVPKGSAQFVVYRTANGGPAPVDVNGVRQCMIHRNGHIVVNVPAGQTTVLSSHLLGGNTSYYRATLKPGERQYVRVELNTGNSIGAALFGAAGATAAGGGEGDFLFRQGNEAEAAATLADCQ